MSRPRLDRLERHEINIHSEDCFQFWDSPVHRGRQNLNLCDSNGRKMLTIYGFTTAQLVSLSEAVADAIRTAPPENDGLSSARPR